MSIVEENPSDQKTEAVPDIEKGPVGVDPGATSRAGGEAGGTETMTLTCEICYDTIEVPKGAEAQATQSIFKLAACSHTFCRECFQETFHSLILEQNRHDDL